MTMILTDSGLTSQNEPSSNSDPNSNPNSNHEEIEQLLNLLPHSYRAPLHGLNQLELLEIVLDFGRLPEARLIGQTIPLSQNPVRLAEIAHVTSRIGEFGGDNRVGIPKTLHRISAIRNRRGEIIGLTLRVGRAVFGTIDLIQDLLESGVNVLLLGRPGVGKTTKLRETSRLLADQLHRRVIVVDTSNEIGGDGDIPHPAIGGARRMQVARPEHQHAVMIEAVENHMPEVIIIDEIGTQSEAAAARTIAERGVQLIGTAHGTTLENLILNPTLSDLVGGVHIVTLSDEEARRQRRPKTITERKAPPTFDVVVELIGRDEVLLHRSTADAVDLILLGRTPRGERRTRATTGEMQVHKLVEPHQKAPMLPVESIGRSPMSAVSQSGITRVYAYELDRDLLERVIRNMRVSAKSVRHPENADLILAPRALASDPTLAEMAQNTDAALYLVRKDNATSMRKALQDLFSVIEGMDPDEVKEAVQETEHALQRAMSERITVELAPRPASIRRMQHRMIARYHLDSESVGSEPLRHLVIHPHGYSHAA
jgi:stage III sporulation protein SpoIIIAA